MHARRSSAPRFAVLVTIGLLACCAEPERGAPVDEGDEMGDEGDDDEAPVCIETCDPVEPSCPPGEACLPTNPGFSCQGLEGLNEDGSGTRHGLHEACEPGTRTCKEGLVCLQALVPGCDGGTSCCVAFCDTTRSECSDGTTCYPFYEAAYMCDPTVGVCVIL